MNFLGNAAAGVQKRRQEPILEATLEEFEAEVQRPSAGWAVLAGAGGGPQLLYRQAKSGSELRGSLALAVPASLALERLYSGAFLQSLFPRLGLQVSEPEHDCSSCSLLRVEGGGLELLRWRRLRVHPDGRAVCWFQPAKEPHEKKSRGRSFGWFPKHSGLADLVGLAEVACGFLVQPVLPESCKLLWHAKLARSGFMLKAALASLCAGPLRRLARDLSAEPPKGDVSAERAEAAEEEDGRAEPCDARMSVQHQEAREEEEEEEEEEEDEESESDKALSDKDDEEDSELCTTGQEDASLEPEGVASAEELSNVSQGILELLEELQMAQETEEPTISGSELGNSANHALAKECKHELDGEDGSLDISDRSGPASSRPLKMPLRFRGQCKVSQWFRQRRRKRMRFPEPRLSVELPQNEEKERSEEVTTGAEPSTFLGTAPRASAIPCLRRPRRAETSQGLAVKAQEVAVEEEKSADSMKSADELQVPCDLNPADAGAHTGPQASPKRRRKKPKQQSWMSVPAEASDAISGLADWLLSLQDSIERDVKVMDVPQLADFFGPSTAQPLQTLRGRGSEKRTGSQSRKQKSRVF